MCYLDLNSLLRQKTNLFVLSKTGLKSRKKFEWNICHFDICSAVKNRPIVKCYAKSTLDKKCCINKQTSAKGINRGYSNDAQCLTSDLTFFT